MTAPDEKLLQELAERLRSPFDPVLSDPVRLRLQAALCAIPGDTELSFTALRSLLGLSDGNAATHLQVLLAAGFVRTGERWRGRRRTTLYQATDTGRAAFAGHVAALHAVTDSGE